MKIVVAPDSFKGSLTAPEACRAITAGLRRTGLNVEIVNIPMADGGEGTVNALVSSTNGTIVHTDVTGPLGEEVEAYFGILGDAGVSPTQTAVIEMAAAAGLPMIPPKKRNPLHTTTYGVGQLICAALDRDCKNFIIGIGGSATNDCGTGMGQALGVKFFDRRGELIRRPLTGERMGMVYSVNTEGLPRQISQCQFAVACDVNNPLLGPQGATFVYGPQKGADKQALLLLETNMTHIIEIIENTLGRNYRDVPGAGAAGGLGAGLMAFTRARLERGIDIVMRYSRFSQRIKDADLVITGEGRIDGSTVYGKTISGIAAAAQEQSIPVIALAGSLGPGAEKVREIGIKYVYALREGTVTAEQAMKNGATLLADRAETALKRFCQIQ